MGTVWSIGVGGSLLWTNLTAQGEPRNFLERGKQVCYINLKTSMNNRWDTDLQKNLATFHEEFCQITYWHISSLLQGSDILLTLTEGVCSFVMLQSSVLVHCWVKTHRGSFDCPTRSRNESKNSEHWTVPPTANGNTGINTSIARMNLLLSKYSSLPVSTSLPPAVLNHVYIFHFKIVLAKCYTLKRKYCKYICNKTNCKYNHVLAF